MPNEAQAPINKSGVGDFAVSSFVDEERLWARHMEIGKFGATGNGGVNRQALTAEDCEARRVVTEWAQALGAAAEMDAIGNLFLSLPGSDSALPTVATGSHLDTQPTGGNFDGIYGVLAGLEAMEAIRQSGLVFRRGVDLIIWNNEEGCRFPPSTMGSAVYAGALSLESALETTDDAGCSVNVALGEMSRKLGLTMDRPFRKPHRAYIEAHIEQGPILEDAERQIGFVTGLQGLRQYVVRVFGQEAHAGTTPMDRRCDAFRDAHRVIGSLFDQASNIDSAIRLTVGSMTVHPGSINTVPSQVTFTIDLRHPNDLVLDHVEDSLMKVVRELGVGGASVETVISSPSSMFDKDLIFRIETASTRLGFSGFPILSGATHDAKHMIDHCPTGMIFVPCAGGVSHNEAESAKSEDLFAGAQVLTDVISDLVQA